MVATASTTRCCRGWASHPSCTPRVTCRPTSALACQAGCRPGCQASCRSGCQVGCRVTCQYTCHAGCQARCRPGCQAGCRATCRHTCQPGCQAGCQAGCILACRVITRVLCRAIRRVLCPVRTKDKTEDGGSRGQSVFPQSAIINLQSEIGWRQSGRTLPGLRMSKPGTLPILIDVLCVAGSMGTRSGQPEWLRWGCCGMLLSVVTIGTGRSSMDSPGDSQRSTAG